MLNIVLLISCICILIGLIGYLFFWNRFVALLLSLVLRLTFWNQDESSIWVDIGSIHLSLLTGRILFKDLRYHSSNQTIKVVKGQISWRYWVRRPAAEEDLSHAHVVGEDLSQKEHSPLSCRVHMSLQGLEWFIYNRTAAYDNIVAQMEDDLPPTPAPTPAGPPSSLDAMDAIRKIFSKTSVMPQSSTLGPSTSLVSSIYQISPGFVKRAVAWLKLQLPNFDPKNVLPMGLEATKGAIICGNASTPSLLVAEFRKAEGTYGIVQSRSKCDLYKQLLNLKFHGASLCYVENNDFQDHMEDIGQKVHEHIKDSRNPPLRQSTYLSFSSFQRLWKRLKLWSVASTPPSRLRSFFGYPSVPIPHPLASWGWRKAHKSLDDETPLGQDFSTMEYAIERKVLEAPILELLYYADVVGVVPFEPLRQNDDAEGLDPFDIGNGDLPPEWGMDFVVKGGFIRYGPWADRQRAILHHLFFPQVFHDMEPTRRLKPGDPRMWTGLKVFIELQDGVTVHIPFREASKDWQWDGKVDVPNRPRKREPASIHVKAGDNSTISYIMPMVVSSSGYRSILEVHLDTITVTSSLNDIRLVTAESCRVRCQLPSSLKWDGERKWTFAVSLRQASIYLLRDHINMLTDLGKDWSSGPPSDYYRFIPMLYAIELDLHNYNINTYVNDHNIIDKPLIRDDNALLTVRGVYLTSAVTIPLLQYRPEATTVSFWVEVPDMGVNLTLPRWNTYSLYPTPDRSNIGRIGLLHLNGSYRYHSEVREENIDLLKLDFITRDIVYKAFGWTVRHFMVLRDNYFGSFTHFSTLYEYLEKRRKGQDVGDPVDLQYRPGKSNSMEVELGFNLDRGMIVLPAGLPGYEVHQVNSTKAGHLGSCLLLSLPALQVQLRTNDYYMDMSLNVDTVYGRFEDHYLDDSSYSRVSSKETILIDEIDITANRLFGPQPRTSTYVCIWEIHVGNVKASLSTYQSQLLSAMAMSFGYNYTDPLNAPAEEFTVASDPDVTFLKITVDSVDVVLLTKQSAAELIIPNGIRMDSNDLAGNLYRKVISLRIPLVSCKALITSDQTSGTWYEASRLDLDVNLDLYSSPSGWQDTARVQREYVSVQDHLTGRARVLYNTAHPEKNVDGIASGRGVLDSDLYLPQIRVPCRGRGPVKHAAKDAPKGSRMEYQHFIPSVSSIGGRQSESDAEEGLSEAIRDARLANSRPVSSPGKETGGDDDDSIFSGDESDDDDLTDSPGWDSDESDELIDHVDNAAWPSIMQYKDLSTRFKATFLERPTLWDGSPFVPMRKNSRHAPPPTRERHVTQGVQPSFQRCADPHAVGQELNSTVLRFSSEKGVTVHFTPLILPIIQSFIEDMVCNRVSPELRFDALLAKLSVSAPTDQGKRVTMMDVSVSSICVSSTQFASTDNAIDGGESSATDSLMTAVSLCVEECRLSACHSESHSDGPGQDAVNFTTNGFSVALKAKSEQGASDTPWEADRSPCHVRGGPSTVYWEDQEASVALGKLTIDLWHTAPAAVFATTAVILRYIGEVLAAWERSGVYSPAIDRRIIYQVLQYSHQRTVVDPLSTIQPSYLVQKGGPDQLRRNSGFKFLVYLRNCLRYLEISERHAVVELLPSHKHDATSTDIEPLLVQQYLSQGLEEDISGLLQQPFLQRLLHERLESPKTVTPSFPDTTCLQLAGLSLMIHHPDSDVRSQIGWDTSSITAHMRCTTFEPTPISNPTKSYPNLSLREAERPKLQHIMLSMTLGNIAFTIFPQLVLFLQTILREYKTHGFLSSSTSPSVPSAPPRSRRPTLGFSGYYLDANLSVKSLTIKAAADQLVVAFSISHLTSASSLLRKNLSERSDTQISLNHSLLAQEIAVHLCSAKDAAAPMDHNVLASLIVGDSKMNAVILQEPRIPPSGRIVVSATNMRFDIPRSILRLYRFIEEWRADYLPGIDTAVQALLLELRSGSDKPPSQAETFHRPMSPNIQIQASISSFCINLQIMLGTWLSWEIRKSFFYLSSGNNTRQNQACTFGLQIGPHVVDISTKTRNEVHHPLTGRIRLELPVVTFKGHYDDSKLQGVVLVEFLNILVKPSDWDTLLSVRQKSGQDFDDLLHLIRQTRPRKADVSMSETSHTVRSSLKISGSARMKGFRIGVEGHSSTVSLKCDDIGGSIDHHRDMAWQFQLSDLALSLASSSRSRSAFDRGHRSAFVTVDFQANMRRQIASGGRLLQVAVTKVHAVMQPTSIGEFGDFVDHLQAAVLVRQEDRENELAQFKEKTRSIMRSFDVKVGETDRESASWLDRYSVSLAIRNIGVAFPLAVNSEVRMPRSGSQQEAAAIRAFLFSIKSLTFGTQHGESGQATMKGFSFQFVQRFRQSIAADFSGDNHHTHNRLLYPEMTAHAWSDRSASSRRVCIGADVSGFVLDLDSSISDYIFSLMDVYRQGKERMDRFASSISRSSLSPDPGARAPSGTQYSSLPASNILMSLTFASGRLRMHSTLPKHETLRSPSAIGTATFISEHFSEMAVEIFDLPVVSVWGEYRAAPPRTKINSISQHLQPSVLMFKSTIHSSQNTLRPTLLPFITELISRVEERMRQSSRPNSESSTLPTQGVLPLVTSEQLSEQIVDPVSGMKISLSLRIDQSKLELTCQPDVNVIAGLHWDSGGFMINIAPGARRVTFTGSVGGLTVGLKHGFLSEDCVRLDARNLAFNVAFVKMESDMEKAANSISVVLDTELLGSVRFSRLQDVLCFKAVWLDRIPIFNTQHTDSANSPLRPSNHAIQGLPSPSQELLTAVLLRFRSIRLDADLGQSISLINLDVHDMLIQTRLGDSSSELTLSVSQIVVSATGNVSGKVAVPDFRFQTVQTYRSVADDASDGRMLDLVITSGIFSIDLESEYQKLIHYRAEPIEVKIFDDWSSISHSVALEERHVDVAFTVSGSAVVVIMHVGTIPKLVSYANKFKLTLESQREGASRESKAFRISSSPKPDNPLSAVANAMLKSTRSRLKEEISFTYAIGQRMSLKLDTLQVVVFPRSMRDTELARFVGRDVHARLDRLVGSDPLPARRDLRLLFSSITTSRFTQLNHAAIARDNVDESKLWLSTLLKDSHEAIIFGLPSMDIQMRGEEVEYGQGRHLRYDFTSHFSVKEGIEDSEDIYITLNMSLYSWLTSLRKTFAREMEQAQAASEARGAVNALVQQSVPFRKRASEALSSRIETDPEDDGERRQAMETSHPPRDDATSVSPGGIILSPPVSPSKSPISPIPRMNPPAPTLNGTSDIPIISAQGKAGGLIYEPRTRHIERLTMRQLGEATPDVMHPFFMKKAGFSLEDSLPQYVHEYATMPTEEIMKALLKIYSKQLRDNQRTGPSI